MLTIIIFFIVEINGTFLARPGPYGPCSENNSNDKRYNSRDNRYNTKMYSKNLKGGFRSLIFEV